jgi:hypothetical protein
MKTNLKTDIEKYGVGVEEITEKSTEAMGI